VSLKQLFKDKRILALAGAKNSGKTNNLVFLISKLSKDKLRKVYFYGFPYSVAKYLKGLGCKEIESIKQMVGKRGCLFVLDEFQKLHLNDRRNKKVLNAVIDFIYHNKNLLLLSSPNIREFNTVIGTVIEKWLLKTIMLDQCINGSQLKEVVKSYSGSYKQIDSIVVPKNEILVINDNQKEVIECDYVEFADSKRNDNIPEFF
jgi:DNA replication protein DnaC